MEMIDVLKLASENNVSDIIITVGKPPQFKMSGAYRALTEAVLDSTQTRQLLFSIMDDAKQKKFEETRELDFSVSIPRVGRYRVNVFKQRGNVGGVLRSIPETIKPLSELGLPDSLLTLANAPRGLVLVTGPTGSGKSTTLAAMIDYVNATRAAHILTIEDPIEIIHPHKLSTVNQRELGNDTLSFSAALRAAMRQAPDVILVGEMRDYETISAAISAAETGHLVMGTLHTNSAPQSVDRIIDVFPEAQHDQIRTQLAESLVGVVTQNLVVRKEGRGRAIAYEIMIATPAIRALIREGKTNQIISAMQTGAAAGMITMDTVLARLVAQHVITMEAAIDKANDPKEVKRLIDTGVGMGPGMSAPSTPAPPPAEERRIGR